MCFVRCALHSILLDMESGNCGSGWGEIGMLLNRPYVIERACISYSIGGQFAITDRGR